MPALQFTPGRAGAWSLWAGSDHYGAWDAFRRAPFSLPLEGVLKVYRIEASFLSGLPIFARYAVEYRSEERICFITIPDLPSVLSSHPVEVLSTGAAMAQLGRHLRKEPTIFFLPLAMPLVFFLTMALYGLWNEYVLHNQDLLSLLARPGCERSCVGKVLSIHSLVALLFLLQSVMLFLPLGLLVFQAPRYRSALNYRMIQSYSLASVVLGAVIFAQLLAFFPFRQYGRFVELGFDPKVERALNSLRNHK
ncbi:MAG: hypothetical protein EOP11_14625 [Proteobacteria bacterium]|nr:MAG: hypothetical protein EOP11_14625 [Pseudomonadota bacterium]